MLKVKLQNLEKFRYERKFIISELEHEEIEYITNEENLYHLKLNFLNLHILDRHRNNLGESLYHVFYPLNEN